VVEKKPKSATSETKKAKAPVKKATTAKAGKEPKTAVKGKGKSSKE
jgi:hypothetical protein